LIDFFLLSSPVFSLVKLLQPPIFWCPL
jgi:hypothetical protein